jgi:RNA polymerase sigma-70 factor (ECF subfamily)
MDTDLVIRAQAGDQEAFADMVAIVADRYLATSHRILGDIGLAEDATQQALLDMWQHLPQLRDPARFEAWSYRLLVRACYAEGRRNRRWAPSLRLLTTEELVHADDAGHVIDRDQLEGAFRSLPLKHRTVVVLHHYLDLPLNQVAEVLGIPPGTVASRFHYALRTMRKTLTTGQRSAGDYGPPPRLPGRGAMSRERRTPEITEPQVNGLLRSFLREDWHEDANRVASMVLDELDATPQRRSWGPAWRTPTMNKFLAIGLGAAAVVAVLLIGSNLLGSGSPDPGGEPPASVAPSEAEPSVEPSAAAGLPVGSSYTLSTEGLLVEATIPAPGWSANEDLLLVKNGNSAAPDGAYALGVWHGPEWYIPGNPCQWQSTMPDTPATTLDEIVAALGSQATRNASAPVDVTVDGYAGKVMTIETPDGPYGASYNPDCDDDKFCTLAYGDTLDTRDCHMWFQEAGQIDELWIVDVDGEFFFVPGSYFSETAASVVDELGAMLGSMTFGE